MDHGRWRESRRCAEVHGLFGAPRCRHEPTALVSRARLRASVRQGGASRVLLGALPAPALLRETETTKGPTWPSDAAKTKAAFDSAPTGGGRSASISVAVRTAAGAA